jgi:hypothetical protein
MNSEITKDHLGLTKAQFNKLLSLTNLRPERYRSTMYGNSQRVSFDAPLPSDNCAFIARKTIVFDKLFIVGEDSSGDVIQIPYGLFSKDKLIELQNYLNMFSSVADPDEKI